MRTETHDLQLCRFSNVVGFVEFTYEVLCMYNSVPVMPPSTTTLSVIPILEPSSTWKHSVRASEFSVANVRSGIQYSLIEGLKYPVAIDQMVGNARTCRVAQTSQRTISVDLHPLLWTGLEAETKLKTWTRERT